MNNIGKYVTALLLSNFVEHLMISEKMKSICSYRSALQWWVLIAAWTLLFLAFLIQIVQNMKINKQALKNNNNNNNNLYFLALIWSQQEDKDLIISVWEKKAEMLSWQNRSRWATL